MTEDYVKGSVQGYAEDYVEDPRHYVGVPGRMMQRNHAASLCLATFQ